MQSFFWEYIFYLADLYITPSKRMWKLLENISEIPELKRALDIKNFAEKGTMKKLLEEDVELKGVKSE